MTTLATLIRTCLFPLALLISVSLGVLYYVVHNQCIDFSPLEQCEQKKATIVLDDQGVEWTRFESDKRNPISFETIPRHVINAFLAAEDRTFFSHQGISLRGIARSLCVNIYHGRKAQGASTITQQLIKLLFFNQHKTFSRKLKEQCYALMVEQQFTKEHILQTYLNNVCFGCGIYGIQAASQRFWGIDTTSLSVDQAATLAGIVRSPTRYCPLRSPLSCQRRRNIVLHQMHTYNLIDDDTYTHARALPIVLAPAEAECIAPHMREALRMFLENKLGKNQLYTGGFIVQSTLNATLQRNALKAFKDHTQILKKQFHETIDGALISLDTTTGGVKALIGGYEFTSSNYNRALQARRQVGSVFKPLVYAAAINQGSSLAHTETDEPFAFEQAHGIWKPNNYNRKFNGEITLAYALSRSNNIVAIKTLLSTGAHHVVDLAKRCQFKGPFHTYPSLALGCIDATLIEVAGMFNIFARNGMYIEPHYIKWVKDDTGKKVIKSTPNTHRVLLSHTSDQVTEVLKHGLNRIKSHYRNSAWIDSESIGKTGTTNDSRTCWFAGSTPSLTTAVYIGYDDNRPMGANVFPIKTAFPIWLSYHKLAHSAQKQFVLDPSLKQIHINQYTGQQCAQSAPDAISILV